MQLWRNFLEGAQIKAWGQRLEWGQLGSYIGEGSSRILPLTSLVPISEGGGGGQLRDRLLRVIKEMGGAEALEKACLVRRGGGATYSGVIVYGDGDDSELYCLPPDWNGDNAPLIGIQTPDQPERGSQEPRLWRAEGTGGWTEPGRRNIERKTSERERGGGVGVGAIRKPKTMGGNTQREWGNVQKMANGIRMRLPLSKSGGEGPRWRGCCQVQGEY